MKQLLLLLCFGNTLAFSQCTGDQGEYETHYDGPLLTNDMEQEKDFSGNYTIPGIKIGGGMQATLLSSGFGSKIFNAEKGISRYTDKQWSQERPGGFVGIAFRLNTRRSIVVGFSGAWNQLWKNEQSYTATKTFQEYDPNQFQPVQQEVTRTLDWSMSQSVRLSNFMLYGDIGLYRFGKRFELFVRPEAGVSNFHHAVIFETKDQCDCENLISKTSTNKVDFTGGLGIGLGINLGAVEFRQVLGYRIYNAVGFASKDYLSQWKGKFDSGSYDFDESKPAVGLFSVDKPETSTLIGRKNGVLYFQVGMYLNFSEILD